MLRIFHLSLIITAIVLMSGFSFGDTGRANAKDANTQQSLEPVPIYTKRVGGRYDIIDWTINPGTPNYLRRHEPNDPSLKGARIIRSNHIQVTLQEGVSEQLGWEGFTQIKFLADAPVTQIGIVDEGGSGSVFIGMAKQNGEAYKFAAASLKSNISGAPQRQTEIYVFIAPEETYVRLGGFIALLSANFQLDARKVGDLILRAGVSKPDVQAAYLANGVDGYYIYIGQLMNTFVQNSINHTNQLLSQQCTGVSGTDADAYGVTGLGNPDC